MTDHELFKQALEALEAGDAADAINVGELIDALRERLARQEQEPVAWVTGKWIERGSETLRTCINIDLPIHTKLYTAPQPREWRGLTEEDSRNIGHEAARGARDVIEVTEQWLRERNA